ncbi:MAG: helix-turn-helix transcriptional regulator [Clostridia bacterium]|nr:helix-turn-helix transcriptional regulator [Clostridia bacterium]
MEKSYASLRQLDHHGSSPIRIYRNDEPDDYPAHWHMQYEIILPVSENYSALVDEKTYEIYPGDVLVIPAGMVHEIFAPPTGLRYIIMVDQEVILSTEGLAAMQHFFYPCVHLRGDRDGELLQEGLELLREAVREHEQGQVLKDAAVCAWVRLFLILAGRRILQENTQEEGQHRHRSSETFLNIYAYINEHCSEKLTLEGVAARSGYSKYHFSRIFRENAGMSFYEYYLRQRLLLCRQLLSDMNMPITEVASRSGFGSLATFNRVFKQHEGVTPTQYRQMRQYRPSGDPDDAGNVKN